MYNVAMSIWQTTGAPCRVEFKVNADEGLISGYAATWDLDLCYDRFVPGAFRDAIAEYMPKNQIKIYRRHDVAVGVPETLREDDRGLWVDARVRPGDSLAGDETLRLAKSGVYDSFSVKYAVDPEKTTYKIEDGKRVRVIGRVRRLPHIGILDDPMNPEAQIHAVKGQGQIVDHDKKSLHLLAEAMEHLAVVEDIRRFAALTDDEAAIARRILRQMREAGAALEEAVGGESQDDNEAMVGFMAAVEEFRSLTRGT